MRKNISRGLFRLWIVLSGLWVAFIVVGVITDPCPVTIPVPEELWNPPPRPSGTLVGPDAQKFLNACTTYYGGETGGLAFVIWPLLHVFFSGRPMATVYGYVSMALGVPAVAFVFGAAVKWVLAGFKV